MDRTRNVFANSINITLRSPALAFLMTVPLWPLPVLTCTKTSILLKKYRKILFIFAMSLTKKPNLNKSFQSSLDFLKFKILGLRVHSITFLNIDTVPITFLQPYYFLRIIRAERSSGRSPERSEASFKFFEFHKIMYIFGSNFNPSLRFWGASLLRGLTNDVHFW